MIIRYPCSNFLNIFIKPAIRLPLVRLLPQTRIRCAAGACEQAEHNPMLPAERATCSSRSMYTARIADISKK